MRGLKLKLALPADSLDEPVVLVNGAAVPKVKLQVMDKMFMPDSFKAKKDQKVELTLESLDEAHGISIPAFNFKLDVGAKEAKSGEFTPDKDGSFPFEDTTDAKNTGTVTVKK